MKDCVVRAVFAAAVVAGCGSAWAGVTVNDYIKEGLVGHWDGERWLEHRRLQVRANGRNGRLEALQGSDAARALNGRDARSTIHRSTASDFGKI